MMIWSLAKSMLGESELCMPPPGSLTLLPPPPPQSVMFFIIENTEVFDPNEIFAKSYFDSYSINRNNYFYMIRY